MNKTTYDIYYEFADGGRKRVSWPCFISAFDVGACLALIAAGGLPANVIRAVAEDSNGEWIAEAVRQGLETKVASLREMS